MEEQGGRRRSKRKLKSVAELERRARELFEQEGEQLYDGSDDESVDIGQLSEEEDVVDSDFDSEEVVGDSEKEAVAAEREARRAERRGGQKGRTGRYVDPEVKKKGKAGGGGARSGGAGKKRARTEGGMDRSSLRKSTRVASARAAERRAVREGRKRRARRVEQFETPTQAERLRAAVQTERENKASLERLLRVEEEKKGAVVERGAVDGERMGLLWRGGDCLVSFSEGVSEERVREALFGTGGGRLEG